MILEALLGASLLVQSESALEMPDPATASDEEIEAYMAFLNDQMASAETPQEVVAGLSQMIYEGSLLTGAYDVDDVYMLTSDLGYTVGHLFGYLDSLEGDFEFEFNFNFNNYDHQTRPTDTETVERPEDEEIQQADFCSRGDAILDEATDRLHNERVDMCLGNFETEGGYEVIRQMLRTYRYDTPQEYGNGYFLMHTDFATSNPDIIPEVTEHMEDLIYAVNQRLTLNVDLEN